MQQHALLQKALGRVSRKGSASAADLFSEGRLQVALTTRFLSSGNCP
jgi:hypothetical protein